MWNLELYVSPIGQTESSEEFSPHNGAIVSCQCTKFTHTYGYLNSQAGVNILRIILVVQRIL